MCRAEAFETSRAHRGCSAPSGVVERDGRGDLALDQRSWGIVVLAVGRDTVRVGIVDPSVEDPGAAVRVTRNTDPCSGGDRCLATLNSMLRIVFLVVWLLLSAWLVIWVGEGLFGVDQRHSILPFAGEDTLGGLRSSSASRRGLLLTFGGMLSGLARRRTPRG